MRIGLQVVLPDPETMLSLHANARDMACCCKQRHICTTLDAQTGGAVPIIAEYPRKFD